MTRVISLCSPRRRARSLTCRPRRRGGGGTHREVSEVVRQPERPHKQRLDRVGSLSKIVELEAVAVLPYFRLAPPGCHRIMRRGRRARERQPELSRRTGPPRPSARTTAPPTHFVMKIGTDTTSEHHAEPLARWRRCLWEIALLCIDVHARVTTTAAGRDFGRLLLIRRMFAVCRNVVYQLRQGFALLRFFAQTAGARRGVGAHCCSDRDQSGCL